MNSMKKKKMEVALVLLMFYSSIATAVDDGPDFHAVVPRFPSSFPNPESNTKACNHVSSHRLCDPDGILQKEEQQRLVERIQQLEEELKETITCNSKHVKSDDEQKDKEKEEKHNVQVAVALTRKMRLDGHYQMGRDDQVDAAAKDFAMYLHNSWGVGEMTPCGGTGIVFFLSVHDRAMYMSRGSALEKILTVRRLGRDILQSPKEELRARQYVSAIDTVLGRVGHYIVERGDVVTQEEWWAEFWETIFLPWGIVVAFVSFVVYKVREERRQARIYAQVESQLSEIDQRRAEALRGQYRCTSCPICLEDFQQEEEEEATIADNENENNESTTTTTTRIMRGSDGQPIKLLRCGHAFDETCWSEWVSNGTGNVRRCPVCQQDVSSNADDVPNHNHNALARNNDDDNNGRIMRQFRREQNFRLARLGLRFPRYIHQDQLERWTRPTHTGPLARDPSFVRNNPIHRTTTTSGGGRRFESSGFGGGSSGGGAGSRW